MNKISVIVPVYKTEKYLRRCLDSILLQTYKDFEIICVNDCSPDGSQLILNEYKKIYNEKFKLIFNEKNLKIGRTKDKGIEIANGDYVVFVDSDDYIKDDYLETYLKTIVQDDADIVVGGYIKDYGDIFVKHKIKNYVWAITTYVIVCAKMYKLSFIKENKLKFSNAESLEDMYFNLTAYCNNPKYCVMEHYQGYYYFYNKDSATNTYKYDQNHEMQTVKVFNDLFTDYGIEKLYEEKYWVLQYTYITNIINSLLTYNRKCGIKKMRNKYIYCFDELKNKFPDYKLNPYIGLTKPKGQTIKIRLSVGIIMLLERIGLDKLVYYLFSLI